MGLHCAAFVAALVFAVSAGPGFADESQASPEPADCAVEMAKKVQAWADRIPGIDARFEQTTQQVALAGGDPPPPATSSGRVRFRKPGQMRFDYERPQRGQVVSDGRELWIYDADAGEAQHLQTTAEYLNGAALQFLMGEGKLLDSFEVRAGRCGDETVDLDLVPRTDASYERLGLRVRRASGDVLATTLHDLFGNETQIRFEALRSEEAPEPAVFRFEVPDGVEVVEIRAAP